VFRIQDLEVSVEGLGGQGQILFGGLGSGSGVQGLWSQRFGVFWGEGARVRVPARSSVPVSGFGSK